MRGLFWALAIIAAAVAVAVFGRLQEGYVLFVYPPWRIEVSLLLFAVAAVLGFAALYFAARLAAGMLSLPATVRRYRDRRARDRAHASLASALHAYFEGRYARALRDATLAWESGPTPGLAALVAARAAHAMRNPEDRDRWLVRAEQAPDSPREARLVTQAGFALDDRDYAGARAALQSLHASGPRHIASVRMLLQAERGAGNWEAVLHLASQLDKRGAIAPALAEQYRVQAQLELLAGAAASERAAFERRWNAMAAAERRHPRIAAAGARHATALGAAALAREIVERGLEADWNPELVERYGDLGALAAAERADEARRRIERAER
jgi:HemY protein